MNLRMMRFVVALLVVCIAGCNLGFEPDEKWMSQDKTLKEARLGHTTNIVTPGEDVGPPDTPVGGTYELIYYPSEVGDLAAYVSTDPGDGERHPAIVWITGGDNNSIGDVWTPMDRENDQSVSAFRRAGIVTMFPSQRGGNSNPGRREGFYGEVNDILAATDYLEKLPYVDPERIYLGGHSTGGTMAMLVGEYSNRYRAVFPLGPVASPADYDGSYMYCNLNDETEIALRSPIYWLHCVESPMYVFEGDFFGNVSSLEQMASVNTNSKVKFFSVPNHDHFTVIAPIAEMIADKIIDGKLDTSQTPVQPIE